MIIYVPGGDVMKLTLPQLRKWLRKSHDKLFASIIVCQRFGGRVVGHGVSPMEIHEAKRQARKLRYK